MKTTYRHKKLTPMKDPLGIAKNIRMVYSDSLKYSYFDSSQACRLFKSRIKFAEFPEGLEVLFFDKLGNKNKVIALWNFIQKLN